MTEPAGSVLREANAAGCVKADKVIKVT